MTLQPLYEGELQMEKTFVLFTGVFIASTVYGT